MEAEHGFVTDYTVDRGNPPDTEALLLALDRHRTRFGRDPAIVATDRGFWSTGNDRACQNRGIRTVVIPQRAAKNPQPVWLSNAAPPFDVRNGGERVAKPP